MEKERFKKFFPHLAKEMENGVSKVSVEQSQSTEEQGIRELRKWAGYNPDVVDFIRRCETTTQAKKIISFLESQGEITDKRATELKEQLMEKGVRSFGRNKEQGFYYTNR